MSEDAKPKEQATELEWLAWFYANADFGPADFDIRDLLRAQFQRETGKSLPNGYADEE